MALDYFGSDLDIAAARAGLVAGAGGAAEAGHRIALAWALRQRDTGEALQQAERGAAALALHGGSDAERGRIALVRAEAAWLQNRIDAAARELAAARQLSAGDPVGLGDADLLDATLRDQVGGDRVGALRAAHARFRAAGAADRERIAATWLACVEATADPDDAQARWGDALDAAAALGEPGLATYVEGARGTLAWRRGDPGGAIVCFQRGVDAALASGQLQAAITLAQNVGIAFSTLNDHEGALSWAERARTLVRPTGWPYASAWCLMQTGSILLGLGRAQAAKDLLLEGLPLLQDCGGSRNHVLGCQVLGEACLELGEDVEALRWCETACAGAAGLGFPDLTSGSLRHLALARSRLGRHDDALAAAAEGLAVAEAAGDWQRVATIHHVLAEVARRAPGGADPARHLEAALAAGARMAGWQAPADWHAELSAVYEARGDLAPALAAERQASQARSRAAQRRADDLATAMLVRHRLEQAQAEASRQRVLADASRLRAELLETQAALEKEKTRALLVHAGKMVAIGRLASGVVHEMSHPVGTVLLLAEALAARVGDGPADVAATLQTLADEARRLQQFVGRLRDFARADPPRLARHDLRAVVADARQLYAPRLAVERVGHDEDVAALAVDVDPQRLALAIANLVFNAADAVAGAAARRIRIHAERHGAEVALHVDDSGPGIGADALPHLFEPFFTTKPAGQGLGLGLALSAESLAAMGGRIVGANRADGGARFSIVLPVPA